MTRHRILFIIITIFICTPAIVSSQSRVRGEIINVNYQYKIAFTDLTSEELSAGDLVEIDTQKQTFVLEVIESSDVMSKLGVPANAMDSLDFKYISVGSTVVKTSPKKTTTQSNLLNEVRSPQSTQPVTERVPSSGSNQSDLASQIEALREENRLIIERERRTSRDLKEAMEVIRELEVSSGGSSSSRRNLDRCDDFEIDRLDEENEELKQKLYILKKRLDYMKELLDENINKYE